MLTEVHHLISFKLGCISTIETFIFNIKIDINVAKGSDIIAISVKKFSYILVLVSTPTHLQLQIAIMPSVFGAKQMKKNVAIII